MTIPEDQTEAAAASEHEGAGGEITEPRFYLLALPERQALYRKLLAPTPYQIEFFDDPEEVVARCVAVPPLGLLIDIASGVRIGAFRMASLSNLEVNWPLLRVKTINGESPMVMSIDPPKRGPLLETLRALHEGDPSWRNARFTRRFIRLRLTCRVRWRLLPDGMWNLGNTLNVSAGGAFIASYTPPNEGVRVEVEIADLAREPFLHQGYVVRRRLWSESPEMPAFGVMFDAGHPELRTALVHWFRKYAAIGATMQNAASHPGVPTSWPTPGGLVAVHFSSSPAPDPSAPPTIKMPEPLPVKIRES